MHASTRFDSQLLSPPGGTTTRALPGSDDTAQPPLTSGFGALMEQEEDIQSSTGRFVGADTGPQAAAMDRILRHQGLRIGANIALLEQRYEMLPHPARFQTLHGEHGRLSQGATPVPTDVAGILPGLIAQHLSLLRKIETLISQRPDGQRGELILAEIGRNHEDMVWMLTALLNEDVVRDAVPVPVVALRESAAGVRNSEANWENEGGALPGA